MTTKRPIDLRQVLLEGARDRLRSLGPNDRHEALLAVHSLHSNASAAGLNDLLPLLNRLEEELIEGRPEAIEDARSQIRACIDALNDDAEDEDDDILESFAAEASDHLESLTHQLERLARRPGDPRALEHAFRTLHTLKGAAAMVGRDQVAHLAHELEDLLQAGLEDGGRWGADELSRLEDGVGELEAAVLSRGSSSRPGPADRVIPGALASRSEASGAPIASDSRPAWPGDAAPSEEGARSEEGERSSLLPHPPVRAGVPPERSETTAILRVPLLHTTELLEAVDDLGVLASKVSRINAEAHQVLNEIWQIHREMSAICRERSAMTELTLRLGHAAASLDAVGDEIERQEASLGRATGSVSRLTRRLRATSAGWMFKRLESAAEEVARRLDRRVVVEKQGEGLEIDRQVSAWALDPLLHIVRNAVAHGIEDPAQRVALGKEAVGRLRFGAVLKGDSIHFELRDDGKGIEAEPLRRALVERGHRTAVEAARADLDELLEAIFLPGFSTRDRADELAGRGMGLNAVRAEVRRHGGSVEVQTWPERGTRFLVRVPRQLETRQVLIVRLDGHRLGLPVSLVRRVERGSGDVEPLPIDATLAGGSGDRPWAVMVEVKGQLRALEVEGIDGFQSVSFSFLGASEDALKPYLGLGVTRDHIAFPILDVAALLPGAPGSHRGKTRATPPRVLVAEDSPSARAKISATLTEAGFAVELAADGLEAWTRLCCDEFDLLVTDLEMPRLHGLDLVERLRSDPELAKPEVVVLTSTRDDRLRERAESLGISAFVLKDQADEALIAAALAVCGSR